MDEKRTLEEVAAIYNLEPQLKDIFVEADSDRFFLEWFLDRKGVFAVTVYAIDLIDIPDEILRKYNLPSHSNRSRVVALSCELATRCLHSLKVLCVVDRDFEDYAPTVSGGAYLAFTDHNSIDLYAFTPEVITKFILVTLGG